MEVKTLYLLTFINEYLFNEICLFTGLFGNIKHLITKCKTLTNY